MSECKECGCKDGDRGPMGLQGPKGDTGATGLQGPMGPQGIAGVKGDTGPQGDQGPQGDAGNDGASTPGPAGPTGAQGVQGPQGDPGNDGADGTDGNDGANGHGMLNYIVDSSASPSTNSPVVNTGIIMKNTAFVNIDLPNASIDDVIQIIGTSIGTGGWQINATGADKIQLTSQVSGSHITTAGGSIIIAPTNYRDVITMVSDGTGMWYVIDCIFANNNTPLFT